MADVKLDSRFSDDIEKAVSYLKEIGCAEIYIFGSIAKGTADDTSDLDIAVRGISPENFFKVYGHLLTILEREIDLVDLDLQKEFGSKLLKSKTLHRVA
jgi:predicted nucleotidyltransferase